MQPSEAIQCATLMLQDGQMEDLHALQQQQYEGYLQTPEQASCMTLKTRGGGHEDALESWSTLD